MFMVGRTSSVCNIQRPDVTWANFSAHTFDAIWEPGLFRLARAKDKSWEIQSFSCGVYAYSVAVRLGNDIHEFIAFGRGFTYYYNGKWQLNSNYHRDNGAFVTTIGGGNVYTNNGIKAENGGRACVDAPSQMSIAIGMDQNSFNLNV